MEVFLVGGRYSGLKFALLHTHTLTYLQEYVKIYTHTQTWAPESTKCVALLDGYLQWDFIEILLK